MSKVEVEVGSALAAAVPPRGIQKNRAHEAQVVLDHVKAAMPDLAENRAQDAQLLFGYVRGACKELGGHDEGDPGAVTVNGMRIWFIKRSMQVFIEAQGAEESASFEMATKAGYSLRNMGLALDECCKIEGTLMRILQRDVMAYAHIIHLSSTEQFRPEKAN
jgi:hypothetical protein